jgi:hypothetical protein
MDRPLEACLLHGVVKCPRYSRAYGFLLPTTIILTHSKMIGYLPNRYWACMPFLTI